MRPLGTTAGSSGCVLPYLIKCCSDLLISIRTLPGSVSVQMNRPNREYGMNLKNGIRIAGLCCWAALLIVPSIALSQGSESPLRIFGYFQNSFYHQTDLIDDSSENTFTVQQLDVILQKNLTHRWTAFIDLEFINSYSSARSWGAFNLERAWVKYRKNQGLNIKLGLLVPKFNRLNEIKNRTPLLPYIIRPIAYETSFSEIIPIEEFVPQRAFIQIYGFVPHKKLKYEYAIYGGNSPDINTDPATGQTGVDTSSTGLIGARIGIRHSAFAFGVSATHEYVNRFRYLLIHEKYGGSIHRFADIPRVRIGGDFSFELKNFFFESEYISAIYDDDEPRLDLDVEFYYVTLGYQINDRLFAFGSYWQSKSRAMRGVGKDFEITGVDFKIPNLGAAYHLNDRVTFKAAAAHGDADFDISEEYGDEFYFYTVAVSVRF